jgi:hypothetical protein
LGDLSIDHIIASASAKIDNKIIGDGPSRPDDAAFKRTVHAAHRPEGVQVVEYLESAAI